MLFRRGRGKEKKKRFLFQGGGNLDLAAKRLMSSGCEKTARKGIFKPGEKKKHLECVSICGEKEGTYGNLGKKNLLSSKGKKRGMREKKGYFLAKVEERRSNSS